MKDFMNEPAMLEMLHRFEAHWMFRVDAFERNFLTKKPEQTIPLEYMRPVTKKEFEELVACVRGTGKVKIIESAGGVVRFNIVIREHHSNNEVLAQTVEMDCRNVIKKYKPVNMQFRVNFVREPSFGVMFSLVDKFTQNLTTVMKALHNAMFPLESELRKLSSAIENVNGRK